MQRSLSARVLTGLVMLLACGVGSVWAAPEKPKGKATVIQTLVADYKRLVDAQKERDGIAAFSASHNPYNKEATEIMVIYYVDPTLAPKNPNYWSYLIPSGLNSCKDTAVWREQHGIIFSHEFQDDASMDTLKSITLDNETCQGR